MRCRFYLQRSGGASIDLGTFDFADEGEARRIALQRLEALTEAVAIDVWADQGELFRVNRPATP